MKKVVFLIILFNFSFLQSQEINYEVFPISVNSVYAEFGVTYLTNNTVVFASSKKNESDINFKKDRRRTNKQLFLELYKSTISENGDLTETVRFTNETNNKFFESDITFSPDKKTVYFTWNNFYNTEKRIDSAKWQTLKLMKASINSVNEISNITPLPFNSDSYSVKNPALSSDGKKLYFVSDMPGGFGKNDIYVVDIFEDGSYGKPLNLGENINTKKDEIFPFLDAQNNLYFASNGHGGFGYLDIFKSKILNGNFQPAINLPAPINSAYDDFAFVLNTEMNAGFFTSNRTESVGDVDIFGFKINTKNTCNQNLIATFLDATTQQKLDNITITIFENDSLIFSWLHQNNPSFNFELNCDKTYKIVAKKNHFIPAELIFKTTTNQNTTLTKTIALKPEVCKNTINGTIVDATTKIPLPNAIVNIFENSTEKRVLLNSKAAFSFSSTCNTNYKIICSLKNYEPITIEFNSTDNKLITKEIQLMPIVEISSKPEITMIETGPIYFDLNSDVITEETAIELDKVVGFLKKYPSVEIEIKSHTDSRAPDDYNLNLSSKRAMSCMNYIITKGINPNRLTAKGYGETELINNCKNGVDCSELEHQQNRRTEFVITKK